MKRITENPIIQVVSLLLLFLLLFILCEAASDIFDAVFLDNILPEGDAWSTAHIYLSFAPEALVFLLYMFISRKDRPMLRTLGTGLSGNKLKKLGWGLLFGAGMNLMCAAAALLHGDIKLYFSSFDPLYFAVLLAAVGIQSGTEEIMCRVFIYQRLRRIFRSMPWAAIAGNALIFSALHLFNNGITVLAFAALLGFGIMYSMLVYYFDSVWIPIIAHTTWNFTQNILLGLPNSGVVFPYAVFKLDAASAVSSFAYDTGFGLEGTITTCVFIVLSCVFIYVYAKKKGFGSTDIWEQTMR